jgi:hypothetical protein
MGGLGSGGPRNVERQAEALRLRAGGLTLAQIARELGCTRQGVHSLLAPSHARPRQPMPCAGCGVLLGPASAGQDRDPALCLTCLADRPHATFGQRQRAHRIAAGPDSGRGS